MLEIIDVSSRKGNGFDDLTGETFGRLTVKGLSPRVSGRKSYWVCQCKCGNEKNVRSDSLKSGDVQSCGCLKKEQDELNLDRTIHGDSQTPLHKRWLHIKERCYDSNSQPYQYYGGRGIKMADEWKEDYEAFKEWSLSNGFKPELTIERIDVNGDYEPGNCAWIPFAEQAHNRRSTVWVEWDGKKQNLTQWADELGINRGTLNSRYNREGMRPPELFRPVKKRRYRGN